jgi:hypothetical protein
MKVFEKEKEIYYVRVPLVPSGALGPRTSSYAWRIREISVGG